MLSIFLHDLVANMGPEQLLALSHDLLVQVLTSSCIQAICSQPLCQIKELILRLLVDLKAALSEVVIDNASCRVRQVSIGLLHLDERLMALTTERLVRVSVQGKLSESLLDLVSRGSGRQVEHPVVVDFRHSYQYFNLWS